MENCIRASAVFVSFLQQYLCPGKMLIFPGSPGNDLLLWGKGTRNTCSFCAIILKFPFRPPYYYFHIECLRPKSLSRRSCSYLICLHTSFIVSRLQRYLISYVELTNRLEVAWLCGVVIQWCEWRVTGELEQIRYFLPLSNSDYYGQPEIVLFMTSYGPAIDQLVLSAWAFG